MCFQLQFFKQITHFFTQLIPFDVIFACAELKQFAVIFTFQLIWTFRNCDVIMPHLKGPVEREEGAQEVQPALHRGLRRHAAGGVRGAWRQGSVPEGEEGRNQG